jgi:hypothetical protein
MVAEVYVVSIRNNRRKLDAEFNDDFCFISKVLYLRGQTGTVRSVGGRDATGRNPLRR